MKEARFRTAENSRARLVSKVIAQIVAQNRRSHQHTAHQPDIDTGRAAGHSHTEEKRIAGQKESRQQPRFGEYDSGQPGQSEVLDNNVRTSSSNRSAL